MILNCDLGRQYKRIKKEIDKAVVSALNSGWYILGKEVEEFEKEFAAYCGARYAIGVGSGTDAIQLALMGCGFKKGEEAITVPNTAVPTVTAITAAGGYPCFVDIDEHSYTMSVESLEDFIKNSTVKKSNGLYNKLTGRKISAIVPVHLYGQCSDIKEISSMARKYNLYLVEDCAQSHGAKYKGKSAGTFGNAGAFSFYPTKNLGGFGDGGAIITDNGKLREKLLMLRNYGQKTRYIHETHGINSRLDEIQAAALRVKLRLLDKWNDERREIAGLYKEMLKDTPVIVPEEGKNKYHVYHLFVIKSKGRDGLLNYLKYNQIIANIHYPIPVHMQKSYRDLGIKKGKCPVAERVCKEILSLPFYPGIRNNEIKRVVEKIKEYYRSVAK